MKSVALKAFPRSLLKRTGVKKVRATSRVPAIIYGGKIKNDLLEVNLKEIEDLIHGAASENVLVDLSVDGAAKARLALLQEVQHHPLSGKILHLDLHEVAEDEKVTVTIPVETEGEPAGVKSSGGVLEHVLFKIKVRGMVRDLPEVIRVDVTKLEVGQAIHLGEITVPANVEILGDKSIPVIAVAAPLTEAQETAATEAAAGGPAEPEMLKEKKEDGAAEGDKGKEKDKAKPAAEKGAEKAGDKGAEKKVEKKAEKKK